MGEVQESIVDALGAEAGTDTVVVAHGGPRVLGSVCFVWGSVGRRWGGRRVSGGGWTGGGVIVTSTTGACDVGVALSVSAAAAVAVGGVAADWAKVTLPVGTGTGGEFRRRGGQCCLRPAGVAVTAVDAGVGTGGAGNSVAVSASVAVVFASVIAV
jgi:hypothetical protein